MEKQRCPLRTLRLCDIPKELVERGGKKMSLLGRTSTMVRGAIAQSERRLSTATFKLPPKPADTPAPRVLAQPHRSGNRGSD